MVRSLLKLRCGGNETSTNPVSGHLSDLERFASPQLGWGFCLGPVMRQVDKVHQFPQATMVATIEGECQAVQMAELGTVLSRVTVVMLMEVIAQLQVSKLLVYMRQCRFTERMIHTDHE